jgi:hypothetical protein
MVWLAFNENNVVFVRAQWACQDTHEVTGVTYILQRAWHAPAVKRNATCETQQSFKKIS